LIVANVKESFYFDSIILISGQSIREFPHTFAQSIKIETLTFDSNFFKNLLNVFFGVLFTLAVGLASVFFLGIIIVVAFNYKLITEYDKAIFMTIVSFVWMIVNFLMSFQFKKHRTFFFSILIMCLVLFFNTIKLGLDTYQKYQEQQIPICNPGEE
jgi:hypothetical protein